MGTGLFTTSSVFSVTRYEVLLLNSKDEGRWVQDENTHSFFMRMSYRLMTG